MKITAVVEFNVPDGTATGDIESTLDKCLAYQLPSEFSYRIMETIAAPYGPEKPDGVYIHVPNKPL